MTKTVKWRGIKTTQIPKYEGQAKTVINRLGQKSITLPRIDDEKRWAGYPGLAGTARKIAKLVPKSKYYIEPFAGTAKVFQELSFNPNFTILNDKSKFITDWLKKEFQNINIWSLDFKECIYKFSDMKDAFFLIDPPWYKSYYDQQFSSFNRESVREYDEEIIELCKKIKGKFIITTRKENKIMLNSGFNHKTVKSEYVVCGKYPEVLLTSNLTFKEQKQ